MTYTENDMAESFCVIEQHYPELIEKLVIDATLGVSAVEKFDVLNDIDKIEPVTLELALLYIDLNYLPDVIYEC